MAITRKSGKELAFLHDLFVATDWGERFAELVDEHVHLPTKGRMLYLGAGTGGHALAIHERTGEKTSILLVEENEESLELAKAKSTAINEQAEFRSGRLDDLDLPDNQFDVVIGNASLISHRRVSRMISEMVRVAAPNATVAIVLPTASSFGEFFSIYWEALHNCGLIDHESDVENLITGLPTISELEQTIETAGLEETASTCQIEEFDFESGEAFLNAPLISDFLMPGWLESLADEDRENVAAEIAKIINEERHEGEFALTVKATLLVGRKAFAH
ncbi:MAG TPA: class I SAM-dependent methyltransferase [Pyrinomonadaceae bacterium]